jgi:hypothetical protein
MKKLLDNNTGDMQPVNCYCEELKEILKHIFRCFQCCGGDMFVKSDYFKLDKKQQQMIVNILEDK